jgi:dephospho-CoA kinase
MRVVGLTGGIACGKSTVGEMLRRLGVPIVDADRIARQIVKPGSPALAAIAREFGADVLQADGTLDRARLGALVFEDPGARARLNALTHPAIQERSAAELAEHARAGAKLAVYDAALILENGLGGAVDALMVVAVPEDVQVDRLVRRDGIDRDAAIARIRAQMPLAEKIAAADWVVDNSGTLAETEARVLGIWQAIEERFRT